jgi:hypothetical protein
MLRDLPHNLKLISGTAAAPANNTAIVSAVVDVKDFERVMFAICTGDIADAGAEFTTLLEESDASDLSGQNAVADADMIGTEAAASFTQANDNSVFGLGYIGNKRYIRLTITPTNNGTAAPIGVLALGVPRVRPAA